MARKKKHAEHENHERWLVSYADLLTLLFALFVVLYAFATAKQTESKQLIQGLMQSFSDMGYISPSTGNSVMTASPNVMSSGESSEQLSIPASKPSMLVQAPTQGGGGVMDVGASTTVPQPSSKSKVKKRMRAPITPVRLLLLLKWAKTARVHHLIKCVRNYALHCSNK
jgi:Flagellar motor protein